MLPVAHKIAFLLFALVMGVLATRAFYRLYRRITAAKGPTESRFDHPVRRAWYALTTTLLQNRVFKNRLGVSIFHSFIFYGFSFYLLVNLVDGLEGFFPLALESTNWPLRLYNLFADVLSAGVLLGVIALVIRRFALPARRDFKFNKLTLLHEDLERGYVTQDSIIVSSFILFHVGSRALGSGAKLALEGRDAWQPFGSLLSHLFSPGNAHAWQIFGFWGALGSVLAFLAYFPYSKHIHIFMAPLKYFVARESASGVLPLVDLAQEVDEPKLGVNLLEDLGWPRMVDAYACIQCNRCQDVCPASATGKSLSPAAYEMNKRMELNRLAKTGPGFESGTPSPRPLLQFALSPEAAWACTTCGACMEVCPVQDEQMLDIVDIRRHQVMIEGEFPQQLQTAFRGMERAKNPWGINHEQRLAWADGLNVKTIEENPEPEVLYWVGCAASYDPASQKTARAFVQLLDHAGVNYAVLGKQECCTGDTARRSGNEYLYRQLADQNVSTLNVVKPKLIVATCPHCLNSVGKEYKQIGGDYKVVHHTEYLESLVQQGKLQPVSANGSSASITYHDPCYLGRHNGVYDAPRNLLNILSTEFTELPRNKENGFCCGAGGAQFWKEEEEGTERISDNRWREVQQTLTAEPNKNGVDEKILAVGCPFCKSMLDSTPGKSAEANIVVKDVAELLLESIKGSLKHALPEPVASVPPTLAQPIHQVPASFAVEAPVALVASPVAVPALDAAPKFSEAVPAMVSDPLPAHVEPLRKKWSPKTSMLSSEAENASVSGPQRSPFDDSPVAPVAEPPRKKWSPKAISETPSEVSNTQADAVLAGPASETVPVQRKKWSPKADISPNPTASAEIPPEPVVETPTTEAEVVVARKKWAPKAASSGPLTVPAAPTPTIETMEASSEAPVVEAPVERKKWVPKNKPQA